MRGQVSAGDRGGKLLSSDVLTKTETVRRIPAVTLRAFLVDALAACGLNAADAATVAGAMLDADLTGSDAHGVFRLAGYVRDFKRGAFNPRAKVNVLERGPATALIDGDHAMGHVVMTYAANLAVELARQSGVGWVGARRSNHAGAGATYATIPLAHGMVGIYSAVSGSNFMAPWGGAEPLLGTNPIAVGIPAGNEAPIMLDIATSVASNGAIRTYANEGRPLPVGWVISREDGEPITDGKRLADMIVHSGFKTFFDILAEHVGRHCNNRNGFCVWKVQRPDAPRRFIAVHFRHLYVHED